MQNIKGRRVGLVLSGGGIKAAAFHIGACLALRDKGFKFAGGTHDQVQNNFRDNDDLTIRTYVGSSAGSFIAAVLASGYSLESLVNAFKVGHGEKADKLDKSMRALDPIGYSDLFRLNGGGIFRLSPTSFLRKSLFSGGFEALIKERFRVNGLFTTKSLARYLSKHVLAIDDFHSLGVSLNVVATQLNHSRKVVFGAFPESYKTERTKYINYAKISDAVAASASLPIVFAPYGIPRPDGKIIHYFDGEVRDTLSTHVAVDRGADLVLASYSVQPYHFTKEFGSLSDYGIPAILNQALYQVIQQKIDKHISHQDTLRSVYTGVQNYLKKAGISAENRDNILNIIETQARFRPEVDYIYIHPRPQNYEMFFADHFSLNPKVLGNIIKIGYRSALFGLKKSGLFNK